MFLPEGARLVDGADDAALREIGAIDDPRERLEAWARRAAEAADPAQAAAAKAEEVREARALGLQQHAVVAGAELIGLIDAVGDLRAAPLERVAWGLKYAVGAALDIPEIPLGVVDQLIAVLSRVLVAQGKQLYAVWQLEARRWFIEGDQALVRDRLERVLPHISRTNHLRNDLDCPGCTLSQFAQYLGPEVQPEVLAEVLEPILSGRRTYRNEDPDLVRVLDLLYGPQESCENGLKASHAFYARSLIRAGRLVEAERHVRTAARWEGTEAFFWVIAAALDLALARDDDDAVRQAVEPVLDELPRHEDAAEALELALLAARALRRLGDPRLGEVRDRVRALAQRLDARLPTPRHVARAEAVIG
jgi:hypothetical protein